MRRRFVLGGVAAVLLAGGAVWKTHLFGRRYAPTPYDDLLDQIVDRKPAARLGATVAGMRPDLTAPALAKMLRQPDQKLATRAIRDAAQNRLMEVDGWLVPESVGLYAALAAKV
jgi:hypothetical protein